MRFSHVSYQIHSMDDPAVFTVFITTTLGVTTVRVRDKIIGFIPTFCALLATSDADLDKFVSNVHSSNSSRGANARILIANGVTMHLKSLHFELADRERCDALPDEPWLQALTVAQLTRFRADRAVYELTKDNNTSSLPDVTVQKFTGTNFDEFMTELTSSAGRVAGIHGIPIDYLMRETNGDYDAAWPSCNEKLKNCLALHGENFKHDAHGQTKCGRW